MNKRTLTALKGSIRKWEKIVAGTRVDRGAANCPLCKLAIELGSYCDACPVRGCITTPYQEWIVHQSQKHAERPMRVICPTCLRLAKKELAFLKSLLPKE